MNEQDRNRNDTDAGRMIVGGAVVVALAYWYVNNHKPSKRRKSIEER